MRDDHQKLLRAMLNARAAFEAANAAQAMAWKAYLDAQSEFLGKFAQTDCPLGPFVCGETLIEHKKYHLKWPPAETVFEYSSVIRCPTSE